ncbi:hypothetical protein QE152_g27272 [Popillia japonica]|uniref:Uncharacterized protein n=1 Tax=Popillia japonica TaxID=7064 RepID=A0AAW1JW73_POPJA
MLLIYGEIRQNAAAASRLMLLFPNRAHPIPTTFVRTVQRLRDSRKLKQNLCGEGGGRSAHILHAEEDVLALVGENTSLSTRAIARQVGASILSFGEQLLHQHDINKNFVSNIRLFETECKILKVPTFGTFKILTLFFDLTSNRDFRQTCEQAFSTAYSYCRRG